MPKPVRTQTPLNFGHILEGVLEQDPMTDRFVIRTVDHAGRPATVDLGELLKPLVGQEVKLTVASLENLARLAKLVEEQGGGEVFGLMPENMPVPFDIRRKT